MREKSSVPDTKNIDDTSFALPQIFHEVLQIALVFKMPVDTCGGTFAL